MPKRKLNDTFAMKDLGVTKQILSMKISKEKKNQTLTLSQQEYIVKVLERFGMQNEKPIFIPLVNHYRVSKDMSPRHKKRLTISQGYICNW